MKTISFVIVKKRKKTNKQYFHLGWREKKIHFVFNFLIDNSLMSFLKNKYKSLLMSNNTVRIRCRITVSNIFGKY